MTPDDMKGLEMSNSIDDIKANEIVTMTRTWHKLFNAAGCDPTCHDCEKKIPIGSKFKLATMPNELEILQDAPEADKGKETREVMLCETCDSQKFMARLRKEDRAYTREKRQRVANGGSGCFRINGKIVP